VRLGGLFWGDFLPTRLFLVRVALYVLFPVWSWDSSGLTVDRVGWTFFVRRLESNSSQLWTASGALLPLRRCRIVSALCRVLFTGFFAVVLRAEQKIGDFLSERAPNHRASSFLASSFGVGFCGCLLSDVKLFG